MTPNAVSKTTNTLRKRLLAMQEGEFVGFEDQLIADLGVSRPTFRQATKILSHEQLLEIKRGVGGGFYVRRPDIETVGHSVSTYLMSRNTTLAQIVEVNAGIMLLAVRAALKTRNEFARGKLASLLERLREAQGRVTASEVLRFEAELMGIVGEMSGNPAVELCMHMFNQFGRDQSATPLYQGHPERVLAWAQVLLSTAEGLLNSDETAALAAFGKRSAYIRDWLSRDLRAGRLEEAAG